MDHAILGVVEILSTVTFEAVGFFGRINFIDLDKIGGMETKVKAILA